MQYQNLFNTIQNVCGFTPLETDMQEIINAYELDMKQTINERKLQFIEKLKPFLETTPKEVLNDFFLYWSEHNENGKKMRFEMEKVFDISKRLSTWKRNKFNKGIKQISKLEENYRSSEEAKRIMGI